MNIDYFCIVKDGDEYKLYDHNTGNILFILKKKFGRYYTSNLYEYEEVVDEIKNWVIKIIKDYPDKITLESKKFDYNKIIKSMLLSKFRNEKLELLGI